MDVLHAFWQKLDGAKHRRYFFRKKLLYWRGWLRKLTFRKIWNVLLTLGSYYYSRIRQNTRHPARPISISIEPTTACNLRCPECPSGLRNFTRDTGNIQKETWKKIIDSLHEDLLSVLFYFQGEPFIHGDLEQMIRYAHERGLYTMTSTNAHFLDPSRAREIVESGLDELIVSIDGLTQEVYSSYRRNGSLEKVLEGVRHLIEAREELASNRPFLVFQFLVVRPNEHQIPAVFEKAREMGVDAVRLKTAQLYDCEDGHPLMPEQRKYRRYEQDASGQYRLKHNLKDHCWKMWHSCVMTWDGRIVPCCFDKDAEHPMGDIRRQDFDEIWNSAVYRHFRERLLQGRSEIDICRNCSEGCSVWI